MASTVFPWCAVEKRSASGTTIARIRHSFVCTHPRERPRPFPPLSLLFCSFFFLLLLSFFFFSTAFSLLPLLFYFMRNILSEFIAGLECYFSVGLESGNKYFEFGDRKKRIFFYSMIYYSSSIRLLNKRMGNILDIF